MTTLAEIRAAGGSVSIEPGDRLRLVGVPDRLHGQVKQSKPYILQALRDESLDGEQFHDSRYSVLLDDLYCAAKSVARYPIVQEECLALIAICWQLDTVFTDSFSAGLSELVVRAGEIRELSDAIAIKSGWLLEGARLRKVAAEVVAEMSVESLNLEALA